MKPSLHDIIQQCCRQERTGQKLLFEQYQGVLYPICLRYAKIDQEAQDIFIEGFYKILSRIGDFKGDGSFEGWMKKIMVNEALMYLRKRKRLLLMVEWKDQDFSEPEESWDEVDYEEILELIQQLPDGYRTIFNLYVLEGYKHREIAEELNISINTSKSQLILAKKRLLELYKKKEILNCKKG